MTAFGGGYKPESQEARALRSINQDSYDYRDQGKLLSKLTGDVSYMAQYMRNMQKGIDDANQNFVEQLTSMVNDLFVIVGGTGNTGFDFGDLKYIIKAIGALFGFDDATGIAKIFPINLLHAGWHFFSTYIVPVNNFPEVINMIIDQAIATILDVLGEVPIIGGAVQHLAQWISNFRMGVANASDILGGIFSDWTEALTTAIKKIVENFKKIIRFFTGNNSEDLDELENWGKRLPIKDVLGKILDVDIPELDAKKLTRGTLLRARLGIQDFENLAAGSDFESADIPWELAASHTVDPTTNKFGSKSLKLAATGTYSESILEGTFNTEEEDEFFVAVWVKRDGSWNAANTSGSRLVIYGNPGETPLGGIYLGANDIGTAGLWHLKKAKVTIPVGSGVTSLTIKITVDANATAGNAWLDNIVIRRIKGNDLIGDDLDAGKLGHGKLLRKLIGIQDFENLAAGSDFESVQHPWTLATAHTVDANTAKFGVQSLKCAANAVAQSSTLQGDFSVTEGDKYLVDLYAKRDSDWNGTGTNSRFVIRGMPGDVVLDSLPLGTANFLLTLWDNKTMRTTIPSGYTSITFAIETGATTGNLWLDNIVVRRVKQGKDIGDGAIGTDHLGDGVVTGGKTSGLDGSKITSGTVLENFIDNLSARKIVRGTLLRERLGVKDFENLAAGSDFEGDHPWTLAANHVVDSTVNKFGRKSLKLIGSGSGTSILQGEFATSEGDEYFIAFWAKKDAAWNSNSTNSKFCVYGVANDVATLIAQVNLGTGDLNQTWSLQKLGFFIEDATNITSLTFSIISGATAGNVWLDNIIIRRVYSTDQIADNAITSPKMAALAVTSEKIADAAINGIKLGPLAVAASHIVDNAVTSGKIGPFAVLAGHIVDNAITSPKMAALSVTSEKIADAAINGTKLGPLAVAAGHIVDNAVTSGKVGPLAIIAGKIAANAVTNATVNADIDASKIFSGSLAEARIGNLSASKITRGTFGSAFIADGAVTSTKLNDLAVTSAKLNDAAVTGTKIGPLAVAASHIVDNAVTSGKVGPLAIIAGKIAANAVTNATVNADIDASKIFSGSLAEARIGNLSASKITRGTFSPSLMPPSLSVGSGIIMRRTVAGAHTMSPSAYMFPTSFYDSVPSNTSDLVISTGGANQLVVTAQYAGWYMVEISFGIKQTTRSFDYHISPALFKGSTVVKIGTALNYYTGVGTAQIIPTNTQASFIVYLDAAESITPGCYTSTSSGGFTYSDLIASNYSYDTYFAVSLLNRSLA